MTWRTMGTANTLELRPEPGGLRHYLDGEPVHCGDILELLTDDGARVLVRYEWNWKQGGPPALCLDQDVAIFASEGTKLRWPGC